MTEQLSEQIVRNKIFTIRGVQVLLDRDLAELYGVSTKALNQAVKRNKQRFPEDFMFKLTVGVKLELVTICDWLNSLKYALTNSYVFTEQVLNALSGVINSSKAIEVNISINRVFFSMRKFISKNANIFLRKLLEFQIKTENNFEKIFEALDNKQFPKN